MQLLSEPNIKKQGVFINSVNRKIDYMIRLLSLKTKQEHLLDDAFNREYTKKETYVSAFMENS